MDSSDRRSHPQSAAANDRISENLETQIDWLNTSLSLSGASPWILDIKTHTLTIVSNSANTNEPTGIPFIDNPRTVYPDYPDDFLKSVKVQETDERRIRTITASIPTMSPEECLQRELPFIGRNGETHWVRLRGRLMCDKNGAPYALAGVFEDVSDEHLSHLRQSRNNQTLKTLTTQALRISQSNLTADLIEHVEYPDSGAKPVVFGENSFTARVKEMSDTIIDGEFRDAFLSFLDRDMLLSDARKLDIPESLTCRLIYQGRIRWGRITRVLWKHPDTGDIWITCTLFALSALDEYASRYNLHVDPLTEILVRSSAEQLMLTRISENPGDTFAVVMIDIDNFKNINDAYGHLFGDKVLTAVASRLRGHFDDNAILGRFGGDEFFFLCRGQEAVLAAEMNDLVSHFNFTLSIDGTSVPLSISAGYSVFPSDGRMFRSLLDQADKALYYSKRKGKNCAARYLVSMSNESRYYQLDLRKVIEGIPGGFLIYKDEGIDGDGPILFANEGLFHIFGCRGQQEFEELTGYTFRGMVHPDDYEAVQKSITEQVETNPMKLDMVSYRIIKRDGEIISVHDFGKLLKQGNDSVFYVFLGVDAEHL